MNRPGPVDRGNRVLFVAAVEHTTSLCAAPGEKVQTQQKE